MHFFVFSSTRTQQQSQHIWNDQNNAFHVVPPLGGRREDKEVSHAVYCCAGKWLMVGNVTAEGDWKTRTAWKRTCCVSHYVLQIPFCDGSYAKLVLASILMEWFIIIEYYLQMLSRLALGVWKQVQILHFQNMPSQCLSPGFMNSKGANKYLHCTVVKFCMVFAPNSAMFL